jgi:drug/metabolite transporter (DMT)-like permease
MNALSWADLTYVLPATSLGYVLLALVAKFALHEQVSPLRWLGIALISGGVGFVAGGPALTAHAHDPEASGQAEKAAVLPTVGGGSDSFQGVPSSTP